MTEINMFRHSRDAVTIPAGEVLFREGDTGENMIAVADGTIELSHRGTVLEQLGPGAIIGEMALVDSRPRSATATAITEARIVHVDKEHFTYLVQEHPTFALQVMAVMADRLRRANG